MPINNTHPEYKRFIPSVERTSDAFEGDVHKYVPQKPSQTPAQYEKFRSAASFYNVLERTAKALIGAMTRKPSSIEGVYNDTPVISGADTIEEMIQSAYADILITGRVGILCDYDEEYNTPYLCTYSSESIVNWSDTFIVLLEHYYTVSDEDNYETVMRCKYRELYLDQDGYYGVRVWYQTGNSDNWEVREQYEPTIRGLRLDYIPFVVANPYDNKMRMCKPPLNTLADINIEHFVLQCQLAHIAWVLSSPTPVMIGDTNDDTTVVGLGGDKFIQMRQGGDVKYLEFSGAGSTFVADQSRSKESQMYNLGSRLLEKAGVESSEALQIRLGSESSTLITVANSLEQALTKSLQWYNSWFMVNADVEVSLNKDFSPVAMSPQEMTALMTLYTSNVITLETLMKRLYEGEVIDSVSEELDGLKEPTNPE